LKRIIGMAKNYQAFINLCFNIFDYYFLARHLAFISSVITKAPVFVSTIEN